VNFLTGISAIGARMIKPNFMIVGAPKCGTTAMHRYLRAHPDIFMPERKEPHFFGRDLDHIPIDVVDEKAYLGLFAAHQGERRVGEASIWYLFSRTAAEEIKAFSPKARIIIMLRNPVDMMYSLYQQLAFVGSETIPTFAGALAAEADRRAGRRIPKTIRRPHALRYREVACFSEQVQRYLDVFGPERVHIIIFDDFKADTPAAYQATLAFLEVDVDFRPEFGIVNSSKRIRSRLFHFGYSYLSVIGMDHLPPAWWPPFNRYVIRVLRTLNTFEAPRPAIDPALKRQLQAEFLPEIERLSSVIDCDLTYWCAG
jgi:hypothetical protein